MADDVREIARRWLDDNGPKDGFTVWSDKEEAKFKKLTGLTQQDLVAIWASKPTYTCCIDFVNHYSEVVLSPFFSGKDKLFPHLGGWRGNTLLAWEKQMAKAGHDMAWLHANLPIWVDASKADANDRPQLGDIVIMKSKIHNFIAYDCPVGAKWTTVDGGQGGKDSGHDGVKRFHDKEHLLSELSGWIDIKRFVDALLQSKPSAPQKTGSLWLNRDGEVVHPDAPDGCRGPGFFCSARSLSAYALDDNLPHPRSPVTRTLDPLTILKVNKDRGKG